MDDKLPFYLKLLVHFFFQHRERKIALKGENKKHLLELMQQAKEASLSCYLVSDAGHTQVAPGSNTVLSIFGKESEVNQITGKLKLL